MIHARTVPFRLLHTSDWHLGRTLHAVPLLADQEVFLAWLIDLLEREPHDALVVAGDVFDRSVPPEDAVAALSRFLVALRSRCPDLPVVVIALEGKNAVAAARNTIGATRPNEAAAGTIRGDLALEVGRNLVHGSDSVENGQIEVANFFTEDELVRWGRATDPWIFE